MKKTKSSSPYDLTILIPAYHEGHRIGKTLDELSSFLKTDKLFKDKKVEIIVVAADTNDNTFSVVNGKKKNFKSLTLLKPGPKVGKGRDVQYGMLRSNGKAVIFMDADLATPLHHMSKFYNSWSSGNDIVIATRNLLKHHPNYIRRLVSNGGNLLFKFASGVWVEDSQCGFKLFSQEAANLCFSKLTILGWGFDMEVLAIAHVNGLKVKCFRVDDWVSVPEGNFEEGIIKNSLVSLKELAYIFGKRVSRNYLETGGAKQ